MNSQLKRQFSKYLANLMSKDEKLSFESKLASDKELKNAFEEYQIGMIAGKRIQYLDLNEKVAQIILEEDLKKGNPKQFMFKNWRIIIAISLVVFALGLITLTYFIDTNENQNGPEVFAQIYRPEGFKSSMRGKYEDKIDIDHIIRKYEEKNWSDLFLNIPKLSEDNKRQPIIKRLKGHAFIAIGDTPSAISAFREAAQVSRSNTDDENIANWYLGLLYTKNEMCDSSIHFLNKLTVLESNTQKTKESKKLLTKIKKANFCKN